MIRELVAREGIDRVVVAGYSLGGNLALKLAGDYGEAPPPELQGVARSRRSWSSTRACARWSGGQNVVYQWNFVRGLKARMRRKVQLHPGALRRRTRWRGVRTVREFDECLHRAALRLRERRATTTTARARCVSSIAFACRR